MIWPPAYVLEALRVARAFGVPFDRAWPGAVRTAAKLSDEPGAWAAAFEATRDVWAAEFAGEPRARPLQALANVGEDLEVDDARAKRRCEHCHGWIPVDRDPRALYCTDKCRRRANYKLERERGHRRAHKPDSHVPLGPPEPDFEIGRSLVLSLAEWTRP